MVSSEYLIPSMVSPEYLVSPEYHGVVEQQDERPATSFRVFPRESHGDFCDLQFSELVTCRLKRPLGPKNKF